MINFYFHFGINFMNCHCFNDLSSQIIFNLLKFSYLTEIYCVMFMGINITVRDRDMCMCMDISLYMGIWLSYDQKQ
jgi:hypothetical protein